MAFKKWHCYEIILAVTIIGFYIGVRNMGILNYRRIVQQPVQYREMRPVILQHKNQTEPSADKEPPGPSTNTDKLRRRIQDSVVDLGHLFKGKLLKIKQQSNNDTVLKMVDQTLEDFVLQQRSIIADIANFSESDSGLWRANEAKELSSLVQRRLLYIQNPTNCTTAKKIVCNMRIHCGFACQVHHVTDCLIIAYASKRTLILESTEWNYKYNVWEDYFMPLSETCVSRQGKPTARWEDAWKKHEDVQVIDRSNIANYYKHRPDYLSLVIPEDISERLVRFHGRPYVWWVGQFVKYVTRLNPITAKWMEVVEKEIGFQHPVVGMHIRRGDHSRTMFDLKEYMVHVEEYYQILERTRTVDKRRVFIATDDPKFSAQAPKLYPEYVFIMNKWNSTRMPPRFSDHGLQGIIMDLYLLARSDFLVCTLTSNVGKGAYELMQTYNADSSEAFHSLDDEYWYTYRKKEATYTALQSHQPRIKGEISLSPGDKVDQLHHYSDGYSYGRNLKSKAKGRFPTYKVRESFKTVKMPTYPQVPLKVTFWNYTA